MITTEEFQHLCLWSTKPKGKIMIVLHGRGDSLKPFRAFDSELKIKGMNYLLLNAPRKYDGGYTWYGFPPNQGPGVLKSREKLFRLMGELESQGFKSKDVFFFGFSQGCLVSIDMAKYFPKPLGGVIGVSGYVYFFKNWKRQLSPAAKKTPILMTHGTLDDALEIEESRKDFVKLKNAGLNIKWAEFKKDHDIDEKKEIPMIRKWVMSRI